VSPSVTLFRAAADLTLLLHLAFVVFVVLGGVLSLRWPWVAWVHVPAAAWGVAIEFGGWICPLTPLENYLRRQSGDTGYAGDFIGHYIVALLYPASLTRGTQFVLGGIAFAVNVWVYWRLVQQRHSQRDRR
jgi:hypothetical protein